jgi:hypothetical protein
MNKNFYITITIVCIIIAIGLFLLKSPLELQSIILQIANLILFVMSIFSYALLSKAAANSNPRKFVNSMLLNTMVRLFSCAGAMLGLIYYYKAATNKTTIFAIMIMYALYSFVDNKFIYKLSKTNTPPQA